jgi:hypothetical protein
MMMMDERDEELFRATVETARRRTAVPDDALLDRVMADADRELAIPAPRAVTPRARRSAAAVLLAALGGWGAVGSMTTATILGIWIGVAQPDGLNALSQAWSGGDTVEVPLTGVETLVGLEGLL